LVRGLGEASPNF